MSNAPWDHGEITLAEFHRTAFGVDAKLSFKDKPALVTMRVEMPREAADCFCDSRRVIPIDSDHMKIRARRMKSYDFKKIYLGRFLLVISFALLAIPCSDLLSKLCREYLAQ